MATQVAQEKSNRQSFRRLQERLDAAPAPWLERLRAEAMQRFEQSGLPTPDQEEWKYTNVAPIARTEFEPAPRESTLDLDAGRLEPFIYQEARHSQLVFVNGIYHPNLSSLSALEKGVVVMELSEALKHEDYARVIREHLAQSADTGDNAFETLNTAMLSSGAFLFIPGGEQVDAPVHLLFLSDTQADVPFVTFPRALIFAARDSSATVIESYASVQEGVYLTNAVLEIVLEENARLTHYKVQRESADAFHVATTRAGLSRSSSYNSTAITLGARLSRHNISVSFMAEGTECWVDGLYIVGEGQHTDTHSLIDHLQPHCTSHQLYKGILEGKSRAVFNGKVFVHKDARGTDAMQTNRNLLLSRDARVDTKPQLEIFNDDVKCAHGATVGQLEEEELFYLVSRGLHPDLARNLLTYGFAEEVIEKIKVNSIKAQLDEAIMDRLHARLEA
jgi:Fe-S cluster assembly protein SufD